MRDNHQIPPPSAGNRIRPMEQIPFFINFWIRPCRNRCVIDEHLNTATLFSHKGTINTVYI